MKKLPTFINEDMPFILKETFANFTFMQKKKEEKLFNSACYNAVFFTMNLDTSVFTEHF